jgi:hypothetical protein
LVNYIDSLNYYVVEELEKQRIAEEKRRKEYEQLQAENERIQMEQKLKADQIAKRAHLAQIRAEMDERRKEKLRRLRYERTGTITEEFRPKSAMKRSEMKTKGIGLTHKSDCHHVSRDDLSRSDSHIYNSSCSHTNRN